MIYVLRPILYILTTDMWVVDTFPLQGSHSPLLAHLELLSSQGLAWCIVPSVLLASENSLGWGDGFAVRMLSSIEKPWVPSPVLHESVMHVPVTQFLAGRVKAQDHSWLHSGLRVSLEYMRPCSSPQSPKRLGGRGRRLSFWGHSGLQSEFHDSQGYTEEPCLEKQNETPITGLFS